MTTAPGRAAALLRSAAHAVPVLSEVRVAKPQQPITSRWSALPVDPRGSTMIGISFRPLQAAALGLDPHRALTELLQYPFPLIRLAAYWNQLEPEAGRLDTSSLDRQIDAAAAAGKQIILCVGAIKAFGYPEFFVPAHHLPEPLPEGADQPAQPWRAAGRGDRVRRPRCRALPRAARDRWLAGRA